MSKVDIILKKADLFERFSISGKRLDFLKSLASEPINFPDNELASVLSSVVNVCSIIVKKFRDDKNVIDVINELEKQYNDLQSNSVTNLISEEEANKKSLDLNSKLSSIRESLNQLSSRGIGADNNLLDQAKHNTQNAIGAISTFRNKKRLDISNSPVIVHPAGTAGVTGAQPTTALFNFYYAKLQEGLKKPDLKVMFAYLPKMQKLVDKIDHMSLEQLAALPDGVGMKDLLNKGKQIISEVNSKVGM